MEYFLVAASLIAVGLAAWCVWITTRTLRSYAKSGSHGSESNVAAVASNEELVRRFIDHSPIACAMFDRAGRYLVFSRRWLSLFEFESESLLGRRHADVAHEDRDHWEDVFSRCMAGETVRGERVVRLRSGRSEEYIAWTCRPWQLEDGSVGGAFYSCEVVTERKQVEEEMREIEERFRNSFESAAIGMALVDTDGSWLQVNKSLCGILGYEEEELLTTSFHDLTHPDDLYSGLSNLRRLIIGEISSYHDEKRYYHKHGHVVWVQLSVSYVRDREGDPLYLVLQVQDITDSKQHQNSLHDAKVEAEDANQAKGEFLANMSHEIRTPIHTIIGNADLALDSDLNDGQEKFVSKVKRSAESLLSIVNDILDFSKIEAGKFRIDPIEFPLRSAVEDIVGSFDVEVAKRDLYLKSDVSLDVPDQVIGDSGRLRQVLVNLVGNAARFTESGGIEIGVAVEEENDADVVLRFSVKDTGIGIAEDKRAAIFDAFTQADGSTTRKYGGTGLGLSISSQLVSLMGGRIWLESTVGEGSTFHFTIQMRRPGAASAQEKIDERLAGLSAVIVADEDSDNGLRKYLEHWDLRVEEFAKSDALIETLRSRTSMPDLLLCASDDIEESFLTCLAEEQKKKPVACSVVLLAEKGQRGDAERCASLGFDAYLSLPVGPDDLQGTLADLVEKDAREAEIVTRYTLREKRSKLNVLIAEDNELSRELAECLLEKWGHEVVSVTNGREATEVVASMSLDLILMDMQMPEMGGIEATEKIREREEETGQRIPILGLTANVLEQDTEACMKAGMDGVLCKPFRSEDLREAIEKLTGSRSGNEDRRVDSCDAIDVALACEALGDYSDMLPRLLEVFFRDVPNQVASLEQALADDTKEEVRRLAHGIKGSAAQVGAEGIRCVSSEMESFAQRGDLAAVSKRTGRLREECERAEAFADAEGLLTPASVEA